MTSQHLFPENPDIQEMIKRVKQLYPDADLDSLLSSFTIAKYANQIQKSTEEHFHAHSLSQGRFTILLILFLFQDLTWTALKISQRARVSKATITILIKKLEADGLVKKKPSPTDGRSNIISLTNKGIKKMQQVMPSHLAQLSNAFSSLTSDQFMQSVKLLESLLDRFKQL